MNKLALQFFTEAELKSMQSIWEIIDKKEFPQKYPDNFINFHMGLMFARENFIKKMGYFLISQNFLNALSKWIKGRRCLEVMAGNGALSFGLKKKKINVIPTDNFSSEISEYWVRKNAMWTSVENLSAVDAIHKYGKETDIIIMSWPYMDDDAYNVLVEMRKENPKLLMVYIGEWGGCTANNNFFQAATLVENDEFVKVIKNFQRWWAFHDYPCLLK